MELAGVLARHRGVFILKDDQVAEVASTQPGSLLNDTLVGDRVVYIRSLSKSIAPDLRVAAVAARGSLLERLVEAKSFADGWTSRLLQRTVSNIMGHPELEAALSFARQKYAERGAAAAEAINEVFMPWGCGTWCPADGVNLYVELPPDASARDAVGRSAAVKVRVAESGPFYIELGQKNTVRLDAGSMPRDTARKAGMLLANAIVASLSTTSGRSTFEHAP